MRRFLSFSGSLRFATWFVLAWVILALLSMLPVRSAGAAEIVIGSKNFSESRLLAEIFAQVLESEGLEVDRRFGLAGTAVCFRALQSGDLDLYPEYTGTGLVTLLELPARGSPAEVLSQVRAEFRTRWDLEWLAPLGFENSYELAVREDLAERHELVRISDLVAVAGELRAGFGYEFENREDGLVGLRRVYGLEFGEVLNFQQALKYQAAGMGELDVLDVYTTDGRILVYELVVLEDDRGVFPPYAACPLVRGDALREHPWIALALSRLAGVFDEDSMRELNRRVEVDGESEAAVARSALLRLGLVAADAGVGRRGDADMGDGAEGNIGSGVDGVRNGQRTTGSSRRDGSFFSYLWNTRAELLRRVGEHLILVALALLLAVLLAVPLALFLVRHTGAAEWVLGAVGVLQTIPSIALLAFMIPLFGVGAKPAVAALFLYALLPIVRNTYIGVRDADSEAVESATALGMSWGQALRFVRIPLAAPVILAGIRTAAVISVGTATLAAFIGAGGLGVPIVSGLQLNDSRVILSGALPAALLALIVDALLATLERALCPRGVGDAG